MLKKEYKKLLDTFLPEYNPVGCWCEVLRKIDEKFGDVMGVSYGECLAYLDVRHERISKQFIKI